MTFTTVLVVANNQNFPLQYLVNTSADYKASFFLWPCFSIFSCLVAIRL